MKNLLWKSTWTWGRVLPWSRIFHCAERQRPARHRGWPRTDRWVRTSRRIRPRTASCCDRRTRSRARTTLRFKFCFSDRRRPRSFALPLRTFETFLRDEIAFPAGTDLERVGLRQGRKSQSADRWRRRGWWRRIDNFEDHRLRWLLLFAGIFSRHFSYWLVRRWRERIQRCFPATKKYIAFELSVTYLKYKKQPSDMKPFSDVF
jgi:hypothetical protein